MTLVSFLVVVVRTIGGGSDIAIMSGGYSGSGCYVDIVKAAVAIKIIKIISYFAI